MKKILLLMVVLMVSVLSNCLYAQMSIELINQDPDPAIAGDLVELRLGIENTDNEAITGLNIEIDEQYPIKLANGEDKLIYVPKIGAYQNDEDKQIIKYNIIIDKDATAGTYKIPLKYYFENPDEYTVQEIEITVSTSDQIEIISIDTTTLKPGEQKEIKFRIKNVGTSSLTDLKFGWTSEEDALLAVAGDNTHFVSSLGAGQIIDIPFEVIADTNAVSGLYKVLTTLSYENEAGVQEVNSEAGFYIGGETDFAVSFSSLSNGELNLDIANIGSNPAYSVLVKIPKQTGYTTSGANTEMIGNLENGDYTVVSYTMDTTRSNNPLKVEVEYTDTRGIRQTTTKEVELNINSAASSTGDFSSEQASERQSSMGNRRNPMSGMSSAISSAKQIGLYVIIGIVALFIVFKIYKSFKKKGKKK